MKQDVFVVANYEGFLIYDSKGQVMMFWHGIQPDPTTIDYSLFCRGITCVDGRFICVGSSTGKVFVITPHKGSFQLYKTRSDHDVAITSLASASFDCADGEVNFASADDSGSILCYNFNEKLMNNVSQTSSDGIPCTSVKVASNNIIIGSFMTGYINIFNSIDGILLTRINAHARIITSIDVSNNLTSDGGVHVISVSEDSFVRVWKVYTPEKNIKVEQVWSEALKDAQPCGVRFCDDEGTSFVTSCYDTKEVLQFSR